MRLDVHELRVQVGGRMIIDGLDITVGSGRMVGLIGPNGSGKSTLIKTVSRAVRSQAGQVLLDGADMGPMNAGTVARHLAVVAQESPTEIEMTLFEMVMLGRLPHQRAFGGASSTDIEIARNAMAAAGVAHLGGRDWQTLSGGEKQRALLARALTQQTSVLILDEPTNHLDIRHQLELLHTVRQLGVTTLAALHDLNLAASFCDDIIVLQDGAVVAAGPPETVLTNEVLAPVFGVHADPVVHPRTGERQLVFSSVNSQQQSEQQPGGETPT